jgi:ribonuclease HI
MTQAWYDSSGREDPLQGGAGYCVNMNGIEVAEGAATIPFETNNVREFIRALKALQLVKIFSQTVQIIGDCKILTKIMREDREMTNPILEEIVKEIRKACEDFKSVKFHHMSRKHNKRADQLATAASISASAGRKALADRGWDPRVERNDKINRLSLVHNAKRYKDMRILGEKADWFLVPCSERLASTSEKTVQEP